MEIGHGQCPDSTAGACMHYTSTGCGDKCTYPHCGTNDCLPQLGANQHSGVKKCEMSTQVGRNDRKRHHQCMSDHGCDQGLQNAKLFLGRVLLLEIK